MVIVSTIILGVLTLTCMVLSVGMMTAWHAFGRQRHALSWAIAYGLASMQWLAGGIGVIASSDHAAALSRGLFIMSLAMLTVGIWQRAGRGVSPRFVAIAATVGAVMAYTLVLSGMAAPRGMTINGIASLVLLAGTWASIPRARAATLPERLFIAMMTLLLLGTFSFAVSAAGLIGPSTGQAYFSITLVLITPIYLGVGVSAIVLIADDMAQAMRRLVTHDPLTGCLNRRGLEEAAARAIAHARRHGQTLSVVICDLDNFKALNDAVGHIAGDAALRHFADTVRERLRVDDLVARIGGDEFALLLLGSDASAAADVVERVREELDGGFSASYGVAALESADRTLEDLVVRADRALYAAKHQGRDRVIRCDQTELAA